MRTLILLIAACFATVADGAPAAAAAPPAPDALVAANANYRVVYEDESIRVLEHSLAVGALEPLHRHPCRFSYAMAGFKTVSQRPGQPRDEAVRQPRTGWWTPAEEHTEKNNGNAIARELITEYKRPPPGAAQCSSGGTLALLAVPPSGLSWTTDAATKLARAELYGDRDRAGPFAQRIKVPAGWRSGLRAHDRELQATILAGELRLRMTEGGPVQVLPAGSFVRMPAGLVHEEWSEAGAEYELRGVGPVLTTPVTK